MRDDDTDAGLKAQTNDSLEIVLGSGGPDLFGDFSVLGAGVHIILDGRTVTSTCR